MSSPHRAPALSRGTNGGHAGRLCQASGEYLLLVQELFQQVLLCLHCSAETIDLHTQFLQYCLLLGLRLRAPFALLDRLLVLAFPKLISQHRQTPILQHAVGLILVHNLKAAVLFVHDKFREILKGGQRDSLVEADNSEQTLAAALEA